jgi:spore maturation protein CgeB
MRIIIVGYYYNIEGFLGGYTALAKKGITVDFFPHLFYQHNLPDKLEGDLISFINGDKKQYHEMVIKSEEDSEPADVLFWWNCAPEDKILDKIKENEKGINVLYSWYDPVSIFLEHKRISDFDVILTSCLSSVEHYKSKGCEKVYHLPIGFDPNIHSYQEDDDYKCDISFVFNNLYNDGVAYERINREELLKTIINNTNYDIKIYGEGRLKEVFPNNYVKQINYNESRLVFSNSKINLNTHISLEGEYYLNERTFQILGSKGLMLSDRIGKLGNGKDCILMERERIVEQITNILENYGDFEAVKEQGNKTALTKYTWKDWANIVFQSVKYCVAEDVVRNDVLEDVRILPKLINKENIIFEMIFLLKAMQRTTLNLRLYLNDLFMITENYGIDINDVIEKYFIELE